MNNASKIRKKIKERNLDFDFEKLERVISYEKMMEELINDKDAHDKMDKLLRGQLVKS